MFWCFYNAVQMDVKKKLSRCSVTAAATQERRRALDQRGLLSFLTLPVDSVSHPTTTLTCLSIVIGLEARTINWLQRLAKF